MISHKVLIPAALFAAFAFSQSRDQAFTVEGHWQVPGKVLNAGEYRLRVEDSLADRSILQIVDSKDKILTTFIAAPAPALPKGSAASAFSFWNQSGDTKAVRAWFPSDGSPAREFVYPKAEAAALVKQYHATVSAIDPESEPTIKKKNLSETDMRVVQLWALSMTQVEPGREGITATKLTSSTSQPPAAAAAPEPAPQRASPSLPDTASSTPLIFLAGVVFLGLSLVRLRKTV